MKIETFHEDEFTFYDKLDSNLDLEIDLNGEYCYIDKESAINIINHLNEMFNLDMVK